MGGHALDGHDEGDQDDYADGDYAWGEDTNDGEAWVLALNSSDGSRRWLVNGAHAENVAEDEHEDSDKELIGPLAPSG